MDVIKYFTERFARIFTKKNFSLKKVKNSLNQKVALGSKMGKYGHLDQQHAVKSWKNAQN